MALEKVDNIAMAFVNRGSITLLTKNDEAPNQDALTSVLEGFKMKSGTLAKAEQLPF